MCSTACEIFRRHFRPMEPLPTGQPPLLRPLEDIRAVLFDLYGTLFISGSGEVGTVAAAADHALAEALRAVGHPPQIPVDWAVEFFFETVRGFHDRLRRQGVDFPEMQVVDVWREVLAELVRRGAVDQRAEAQIDLARLAVEYEARANPCWPMPGLDDCLGALRAKGVLTGIISNAQFYTPALFPALLDRSAEQCGFDPRLQYYSYQHGRAKPGTALYEMARDELAARGVRPESVLYVGNDVLNDVVPAGRVGFRAALFAGDARSLRLRRDEPQWDGTQPDVVLTALVQIDQCIMMV
jgi:putative hydrolase of the HAD superfamily